MTAFCDLAAENSEDITPQNTRFWVLPAQTANSNFAIENKPYHSQMEKSHKNKMISWRRIHRWIGIPGVVFLFIFCISGIILNHRETFASIDVSRTLLPGSYALKKYNNGSARGTTRLGRDSILLFGNTGIWLTDSSLSRFADFNRGIDKGVDNRNIRNIVKTNDGKVWCATQFKLYRLAETGTWVNVELPGNDERLSDLTLTPDSTSVVALTRSAVYVPDGDSFRRVIPEAPEGYIRRVSLFKTVWKLHSGELFGTPGKLFVDFIALAIIILSFTGLAIFIIPISIRHSAGGEIAGKTARLKKHLMWHNSIGLYTILFTLLIGGTGMCLRPPVMIPLAITGTAPLPGSALDSDNPWHDKLQAIRYDDATGSWLIATTDGFILSNTDFSGKPRKISKDKAPPLSPMGVNVFCRDADGDWLVGSFSGLYKWNPATGIVTDYFTGKTTSSDGGRPTGQHLVNGYSSDLSTGPVVFDYSLGAPELPPMPEELAAMPMSLWNVALELHVGRCYAPVLGPFSALFVFLSGLFLITALLSGLILERRQHRHKNP